jgi:hypothetical protein
MNYKLLKLAERRKLLVSELAMQRLILSQNIDGLHAPLALADRGLSVIRYIKQHPAWVASSSLAALSIVRPNRIVKWFIRGRLAWQIIRKLRN